MKSCPFCPEKLPPRAGEKRRRYRLPQVASHVSWYGATGMGGVCAVFEPVNPVTPGHMLVVPVEHVEHAATDPHVSARAMEIAATVAQRYRSANIITSIGRPATQTVKHLHLHVVPRRDGDGLHLPWTGQ
jgi:histidine triad (HIT) family protein